MEILYGRRPFFATGMVRRAKRAGPKIGPARIVRQSLSHIPKPEKAQRMEKMGTMKMNQQYGIYSVPQPSTSITYSVATPQGTMGALRVPASSSVRERTLRWMPMRSKASSKVCSVTMMATVWPPAVRKLTM